eukprot:scaffold129901_cov32-Prasinocladus_malaysianus.AAC.1
MQRGARIVQLRMGQPVQSASTWLRLEDGQSVFQAPRSALRREFQLMCHGGGPHPENVLPLLRLIAFLFCKSCRIAKATAMNSYARETTQSYDCTH